MDLKANDLLKLIDKDVEVSGGRFHVNGVTGVFNIPGSTDQEVTLIGYWLQEDGVVPEHPRLEHLDAPLSTLKLSLK